MVVGLIEGFAVASGRVGSPVEGRKDGAVVVGARVSAMPVVGVNVESFATTVGDNVGALDGPNVDATQSPGGSSDRSHIPCLIQASNPDTRAYTAGIPSLAQPEPKLTIPICRPSDENNGPPVVLT